METISTKLVETALLIASYVSSMRSRLSQASGSVMIAKQGGSDIGKFP